MYFLLCFYNFIFPFSVLAFSKLPTQKLWLWGSGRFLGCSDLRHFLLFSLQSSFFIGSSVRKGQIFYVLSLVLFPRWRWRAAVFPLLIRLAERGRCIGYNGRWQDHQTTFRPWEWGEEGGMAVSVLRPLQVQAGGEEQFSPKQFQCSLLPRIPFTEHLDTERHSRIPSPIYTDP